MEQLELLWNLEIHHNSLELNQKELSELNNSFEIRELMGIIASTKEELHESELEQEDNNHQIEKLEKELVDYTYEKDQIDKSLYKGDIQDIKQLEYLSLEKDKIQGTVNKIETKILELLDNIDIMDKKILNLQSDLRENQIIYNKKIKKYKELLNNVNTKIQEDEAKIKTSEEIIDKGLLSRYNTLRKSRSSGISEVIDGICGGCNMHIPTYLISKLIANEEIVYCESCGRILCKL